GDHRDEQGGDAGEGPVDFQRPVERLAVHDLHEDEAYGNARDEADNGAERAPDRAFDPQEVKHLAAAQAQEAKHAEFAPPRPGERREAARDAREPDDDRDRLERVGHREAAVEELERAAVYSGSILDA